MKNTFKLRDSQVNLLISLLRDHKRDGAYWGNKKKHYALVEETLKTLGHKEPDRGEP